MMRLYNGLSERTRQYLYNSTQLGICERLRDSLYERMYERLYEPLYDRLHNSLYNRLGGVE